MRSAMLDVHIMMATTLLIVAVIMDMLTGKFPNWLFVLSYILGACWLVFNMDSVGVMKGILFSIIIFAVLAPLVFLNALGAGDVKLLTAFSLFVGWQTTVDTFIYSLFWGLLLGVLKILLSGEAKNIKNLAFKKDKSKTNKIPYTVAILLGWMSVLSVGGFL